MKTYHPKSLVLALLSALLEGALPATEWNSERICSLPLFPDMALEDVDSVVTDIKEVLA